MLYSLKKLTGAHCQKEGDLIHLSLFIKNTNNETPNYLKELLPIKLALTDQLLKMQIILAFQNQELNI